MMSEANLVDELTPDTGAGASMTRDKPPEGAPVVLRHPKPERRRIVFLGNCQLGMLSGLYRSMLSPNSVVEVSYVASYSEATETEKHLVATADVLVQQILDFVPRIGDLPTRAKVHFVPHISSAFLWPYSGEAHPCNRPEPALDPGGPYPPELGDSFLNRMIAAGVGPDEAVARYLETDVPRTRRVDRVMELVLDRQRNRDKSCGYAFADYIESGFRSNCLFRSPNHPELPTAIRFSSEVFGRLDVDPAVLDKLRAAPPQQLFPPTETPIHPAVVEHFGLNYAPPTRRYRYFAEGGFTFEEYAHRYMHYEWSAVLAEGLHLVRVGQLEMGMAKLETAMPTAPRAANARIILADMLERVGRLSEAVVYAREATDIEPTNRRYAERLAQISQYWTQKEKAEQSTSAEGPATRTVSRKRHDDGCASAFASAVSVAAEEQSDLDIGIAAARAVRTRGDLAAAFNLFMQLWERFPGNPLPLRHAATTLMDARRLDEAEALLEQDSSLLANDAGVAIDHAWVAHRRRDYAEAIRRWQLVQTRHPDHSIGWSGAVTSLREAGELDSAEDAISTALTRFPNDVSLSMESGWIAMARGDLGLAVEQWRRTRERFPGHWSAYAAEARALIDVERLAEAETLLSAAIARFPDQPALLVDFARTATGRRDWPEALQRWRSVRRAMPTYVAAYRSEAAALRELQRDEESEAALTEAMTLFPNDLGILIDRAKIAQRRRDLTEALDRWEVVRARCPNEPAGYAGKVDMLRKVGRLDDAEALLSDAMDLFPSHIGLRIAHCDIAADRQDWQTALRRLKDALLRFPNEQRFVQREFKIRVRLSEAAQDADEARRRHP